MDTESLRSPFYESAEAMGATFMEARGWLWTEGFGDPDTEYRGVRHDLEVWDVSPLNKWELRGPDALAAAQRLHTNNILGMEVGQVRYGAFCDVEGMMVDDGTVYRLDDRVWVMTIGSGHAEHFAEVTDGLDVSIEAVTLAMPHLGLQGPRAREALGPLCDADLSGLHGEPVGILTSPAVSPAFGLIALAILATPRSGGRGPRLRKPHSPRVVQPCHHPESKTHHLREELLMSDLLLADEREAVASASRHLAKTGLVIGTAGNISARKDDLVAVTPTGSDLGDVTAEMVAVITLEGEHVDGDLAATSEVPLHTGIYKATNARAVTHAHAMASTALSCTHDELPPLHYSCLGLGGAPRTAPYATFGSQELADNVIEALKGRNAAMMRNHGSIAYGNTMSEAIERLELLEWLAELYWRSSSMGTPHILTDKDFEAIIMSAMQKGYGSLKKVDKKE